MTVLQKLTGLNGDKNILEWCDKQDDKVFEDNIEIKRFLEIRNEIKSIPQCDENFLMAFDGTSLYPCKCNVGW